MNLHETKINKKKWINSGDETVDASGLEKLFPPLVMLSTFPDVLPESIPVDLLGGTAIEMKWLQLKIQRVQNVSLVLAIDERRCQVLQQIHLCFIFHQFQLIVFGNVDLDSAVV